LDDTEESSSFQTSEFLRSVEIVRNCRSVPGYRLKTRLSCSFKPCSLSTQAPTLSRILQLSGPHISVKVDSDAFTCPIPPYLISRLRCCHVLYVFGLHLSAKEASDVVVCHMASDPASRPGRILVLSRVLWSPIGCVPQIYKEMSSWPRHAARLACFQDMITCYRCGCKMYGHAVSS
jgi:hypothetical protein